MSFSTTANDVAEHQASPSGALADLRMPVRAGVNRFSTMCAIAAPVAIAAGLAAVFAGHALVGFYVGAVLCGMAEALGRCGQSHIGMIAPLRHGAQRLWFKCASAYSVGGLVTSCMVGLVLGGLGSLAATAVHPSFLFVGGGLVGLAMLLRELGAVRFSPPQCDVQTHYIWVMEFGRVTAAAMWGSHIGLAVTTVIKHGGLYPILVIAFAVGLGGGEWLLVAFWLGRIIPFWLAPFLYKTSNAGLICDSLREAASSFKAAAALGLATLSTFCVVAAWAVASNT